MAICVNLGQLALTNLMILSALICGFNYLDYDHLYVDHLAHEARSLLDGVRAGPDGLLFDLPKSLDHYNGKYRNAYGFRVLDKTGHVIAERRSALIEAASPWSPNSTITTDLWFMRLPGGGAFSPHFTGGKRLEVDGTEVLFEMVTLGDPAGIRWWAVLHETAWDVWLPMLPFVILLPLVSVLTVRRALEPLSRAAEQAEAINPRDPTQRLDLIGLPHETVSFASAINRLMERVGALVHSEKVFVASAAHELRTPLAVMLLELEKIDHPLDPRLEADLRGIAECVNRLVLLARLETLQPPEMKELDLATLAGEAVERLRPWAAVHNHKIDIRMKKPSRLRGDPVAVREALQNLIENAVKHTPAGPSICVTVGPDRTVTVEDSGPGLANEAPDQLFQPFRKGNSASAGSGLGLTIVRQAVELHRGSIQVGRSSSLGGAMFRLSFA